MQFTEIPGRRTSCVSYEKLVTPSFERCLRRLVWWNNHQSAVRLIMIAR